MGNFRYDSFIWRFQFLVQFEPIKGTLENAKDVIHAIMEHAGVRKKFHNNLIMEHAGVQMNLLFILLKNLGFLKNLQRI